MSESRWTDSRLAPKNFMQRIKCFPRGSGAELNTVAPREVRPGTYPLHRYQPSQCSPTVTHIIGFWGYGFTAFNDTGSQR